MLFQAFGVEVFTLPSRGFSDVVMTLGKMGEDVLVVKLEEFVDGGSTVSRHAFPFPAHMAYSAGMRFSAVVVAIEGRPQPLDVVRLCAHQPGDWTSSTILVYKDASTDPRSILEMREGPGVQQAVVHTASSFLHRRRQLGIERITRRNVFDYDRRFTMARDIPDAYDHPITFARQNKTTDELQVLFPHARPTIYNNGSTLGAFPMLARVASGRDQDSHRVSFVLPTWITLPTITDEAEVNSYGDVTYAPVRVSGLQCMHNAVIVWYVMQGGSVHFLCCLVDGRIKHASIEVGQVAHFRVGSRFAFLYDSSTESYQIVHRTQTTGGEHTKSTPLFRVSDAPCPVPQQVSLVGVNVALKITTSRLVGKLVNLLNSHQDVDSFGHDFRRVIKHMRVVWAMVDAIKTDPFRTWFDPLAIRVGGHMRDPLDETVMCAALIAASSPARGFDPPIYLFSHAYESVSVRHTVGHLSESLIRDNDSTFKQLLTRLRIARIPVYADNFDAWFQVLLGEKLVRAAAGTPPTMSDYIVAEKFESLVAEREHYRQYVHDIPGARGRIGRLFKIIEMRAELESVASPIAAVFNMAYILAEMGLKEPNFALVCPRIIQLINDLVLPGKAGAASDALRGRVIAIHSNEYRPGDSFIPRNMVIIDASKVPLRVFFGVQGMDVLGFRLLVAEVLTICKQLVFQYRLVDGAYVYDASLPSVEASSAKIYLHTSLLDHTFPFSTVSDVVSEDVLDDAVRNPSNRLARVTRIARVTHADYAVTFRRDGGEEPEEEEEDEEDERGPVEEEEEEDEEDERGPANVLDEGDIPNWHEHTEFMPDEPDMGMTRGGYIRAPDDGDDHAFKIDEAKAVIHEDVLADDPAIVHSYAYDMMVESLALVGVSSRVKALHLGVDMPVFHTGSHLPSRIHRIHKTLVRLKHPYYVLRSEEEVQGAWDSVAETDDEVGDGKYRLSGVDDAVGIYEAWAIAAALSTNGLGADARVRTFGFMFVDLFLLRAHHLICHFDTMHNGVAHMLIRWHGCIADDRLSADLTPRDTLTVLDAFIESLVQGESIIDTELWIEEVGNGTVTTAYEFAARHVVPGRGDLVALHSPVGANSYRGCAVSFGVAWVDDGYPTVVSLRDTDDDVEVLDVNAFLEGPTMHHLVSAYEVYADKLDIPVTLYDYAGLAVMANPADPKLMYRDLSSVAMMRARIRSVDRKVDTVAFDLSAYRGLALPTGLATYMGFAPMCVFAHGVAMALQGGHDMRNALHAHVPVVEFRDEELHLVGPGTDLARLLDLVVAGNNLIFSDENPSSLSGVFKEFATGDSTKDVAATAYTIQMLFAQILSVSNMSTQDIPVMGHVVHILEHFDRSAFKHFLGVLVDDLDRRFADIKSFEAFVTAFGDAPSILDALGDVDGFSIERVLARADEMTTRLWAGDNRIAAFDLQRVARVAGRLVGCTRVYQPIPRVHAGVCVGARLTIVRDGIPSRSRLVDIVRQLFTFAGVVRRCEQAVSGDHFASDMDEMRREFYFGSS